MRSKIKSTKDTAPDQIPLTTLQATRLASLSGVESKLLNGMKIAEIEEKFKWKIDPKLLWFQKVCGRVVKRDPATDELLPVPYATVHVEDTDCQLMGYFPTNSNWCWYYPLLCRREELSTVLTDACGNFCVYIPRFEIDWILHWRKARICYPIIFERPTLKDILDRIRPEPPRIRWPIPQPDPGPLLAEPSQAVFLKQLSGNAAFRRLSNLQATAQLGDSNEEINQLLNSPAFSKRLPPPLPVELRKSFAERNTSVLANHMAVSEKVLQNIDQRYYIGPFKRCVDVYFPQWKMIADVPDITFRVTQDVDGDGDEETIYSEALFDVRWNDSNIPDVILEASQIALTSMDCNPPADMPCGTSAVVLAGKMPLHNEAAPALPYVNSNGYAQRVNRPHPNSLYNEAPDGLATTPMAGVFPLYGCNQHDGAKYYRLRYIHTPENTNTATAKKTFEGHSWTLYRWTGQLEKLLVNSDSEGWYRILDPDDAWMPAYLLLNWPTNQYADGLYEIEMELANTSKVLMHTTDSVKVRIDNSRPVPVFTSLRWRHSDEVAWHVEDLDCPLIQRSAGKSIIIEVSYEASADHLRSLSLSGEGCGASGQLELFSTADTTSWWYPHASDNVVAKTASFQLAGSAASGAYEFNLRATSRAFNPVVATGLTYDWWIDVEHLWRDAELRFAVVEQ